MSKRILFFLVLLAVTSPVKAQTNEDAATHMKRVSDLSRQWRVCLNEAAALYAANSCRSHTDLTKAAFGKCSVEERAVIDAMMAAGATNARAIIDSSRNQYEEIIGSQILDHQIERNCQQ